MVERWSLPSGNVDPGVMPCAIEHSGVDGGNKMRREQVMFIFPAPLFPSNSGPFRRHRSGSARRRVKMLIEENVRFKCRSNV